MNFSRPPPPLVLAFARRIVEAMGIYISINMKVSVYQFEKKSNGRYIMRRQDWRIRQSFGSKRAVRVPTADGIDTGSTLAMNPRNLRVSFRHHYDANNDEQEEHEASPEIGALCARCKGPLHR